MTDKELKKISQRIKNERRGGAPADVWVKNNRDILMMQVRNTMDVRPQTLGQTVRHFFDLFVPADSLMMVARAAAVFVLALGSVLGGGFASVAAYRDAIPGELFYPVKLATEKTQLVLAPNDQYRTRLHLEFAGRRVDEVARIAEDANTRADLAADVLVAFESEVVDIKNGLEKLRTSDPADVIEVAKLAERKLDTYQTTLKKAAATLPSAAKPALAKASDLIDGTAISAIAVIVEKHLEGDAQAPKNVVVVKIEDKLKEAEAKLATVTATQSEASTTKAKAAIAEAKALIQSDNYSAALTKMIEVAELTKEVEKAAEPSVSSETGKENQTPTSDTSASTGTPATADAAAGSDNQ